jgi:hypothetical protein
MKHVTLGRCALVSALMMLVAGCSTRSISNSGYHGRASHSSGGMGYRGELSEFDVVGVTPDNTIAEDDIQAALRNHQRPRLERNSRILLVQSGAEFPDDAMVSALNQRFRVLPFSGKPPVKTEQGQTYSKSLRLAAAQGGYDKIICYWGVLESEQRKQVTKAVSWVPIVGHFVPDEKENMRIRLKAVIVDVASGRWTFVVPPSAMSSDFSSSLSRESTDQGLVAKLKHAGYQNLAHVLLEDHTE